MGLLSNALVKFLTWTYSLLATKSHDFKGIADAIKVVTNIFEESNMHVSFCAEFGITLEELESTLESPATTAYGAFLLDTGIQGIVPCRT